jgi:DNA-binding response OmpR family regulator
VNPDKKQGRILVVDDEPSIVTAIEFLLMRIGCIVDKAYNGLQALELAVEHQPDVVILDVMMPGMDGFETSTQIRNIAALENTRIIFLTAKGADRDKQTGYAKGAEYYMVKPFDNDELVTVVKEILTYG